MFILWIVIGVVVILALWLIITFNGLIRMRNQVDEGWSEFDFGLSSIVKLRIKRNDEMIQVVFLLVT